MTAPSIQPNGNKIEAWLHEHGVTEYEYKARVPLAQIDRKASRTNQARPLNPVNEDWAIVLAEAYERDASALPPLVVWKQPGGKLKILDGNHRDAAADLASLTHVPAYVVTQTLSETQQRVLAYTANLRNGLHVDLDTRVRHAVWLAEARGMSQIEAAKVVGVPPTKVKHRMEIERAARRLEAFDRKIAAKTGQQVRVRLDNIRSERVYGEAVKLVHEASMAAPEVNDLVTRLNKTRTEADALALLAEERKHRTEDVQATAGGVVKPPAIIVNLKSTLSRIQRLDLDDVRDVDADPLVKGALKAQTTEAMNKLAALLEVL